jgi:6-phosphogluconolactonase (cycloisomerase 2 family)
MPSFRSLPLAVAVALCLLLPSCGSSNHSTPPPPPPAPLGFTYVSTPYDLYSYSITASDGSLALVGTPFGLPGIGKSVATGGSTHLYALTSNGVVTVNSIDRNTGLLAQIPGSPFTGPPNGVAYLAVDPANKYVFIPAPSDSAIFTFFVDPVTNFLTPGAEVSTPATPNTATVDPQSHFLYVTMGTAGTQLFQLNGGLPQSVKTIPPLANGSAQYAAITPGDGFAYISDGINGVAAYSVNPGTGDLTPISNTAYTAGTGASVLAISPNGKFLYVGTAATIAAFGINADGTLASIGSPVTLGSPPLAMSIEPSGAYLFAVTLNSNVINSFRIDSSSGALTLLPNAAAPSNAIGVATAP